MIGGGIAGITTAEILAREGHSVILIEKNKSIASETTREFHEWLHTGSLYTLVPNRLTMLRFILGALDDLIEYYTSFEGMNIIPTENGLRINSIINGWFDANYIHFKYRVNGRKLTIPWIYGVARSIFLIERIWNHDWLRRRAGELIYSKVGKHQRIRGLVSELLLQKEPYKLIKTPDFTINSRKLLRDLIGTAIYNGLELSIENKITNIYKEGNLKILHGTKENIMANKVALCNSSEIMKFAKVKTSTSYAPIAVVSGLPKNEISFVELDYFPKNCINLLTKNNGIGLAGGISMREKEKCNEYLNYVINKHRKLNPSLKEESRYIGVKNEITFNKEQRGYLFHIVEDSKDIWALVPGKFTLAFSMAPEFYRQVYHKNPRKNFNAIKLNRRLNNLVSNTVWEDVLNNLGGKNGFDKITKKID